MGALVRDRNYSQRQKIVKNGIVLMWFKYETASDLRPASKEVSEYTTLTMVVYKDSDRPLKVSNLSVCSTNLLIPNVNAFLISWISTLP